MIRSDCLADHMVAHQFDEDAREEDEQIQLQINMINRNVSQQQERISAMDQIMV